MRFDAAALTRLREERGWSQLELAHTAGVDPGTVSRLESGERVDPKLSTVIRIANALDTTAEHLVTDHPQSGGSE